VRTLELARVAARAELLYVRRLLRRQGMRATLALVAALFLLAALAALHVAAALALRAVVTPLQAVLIVCAADTAIGLVLALLAARDRPGAAEREAVALRDEACAAVARTAANAALIASLLRLLRRATRRP
jgi:hypothetical protein